MENGDASEEAKSSYFDTFNSNVRKPRTCRFSARRNLKAKQFSRREERYASFKKVSMLLQKSEELRTSEDNQLLDACPEIVKRVQLRWKKRDEAKRRLEEIQDPEDVLYEKCFQIAQAISRSRHLIVYTGAGISTAAKIPDYRGPNGIWTKLREGKDIGKHDLSLAEPTYTHMALAQLHHQNLLKHVVSQNCDGLHLRSGLPRLALSELHGNMYIEVCKNCTQPKEYLRLFDVTENTARFSHKTMRRCYFCYGPLVDTIVHFGERGTLSWPLNWAGACRNAKRATTILCLGSSLKVLKRYPWLWQMDKPAKKRPDLYIVNLQWTPKDDSAVVKIHGECDKVMRIVMNMLNISVPGYNRGTDPIFFHATLLCKEELHTTTKSSLKLSSDDQSGVCVNQTLESIKLEKSAGDSSNLPENGRFSGSCLEKWETQLKIIASPNEKIFLPSRPLSKSKCENSFSIENILKTEVKTESLPHKSNFNYSFFNVFSLGNSEPRYPDLYFYPYQTSFLYSGLHSIIPSLHLNGGTYWNAEKSERRTDNSDVQRHDGIGSNIVQHASCIFCFERYRSPSCLFYSKCIPCFAAVRAKTPHAKKNSGCLCCGSFKDAANSSVRERYNVVTVRKGKNKGWFGKGYRINKRNRKPAISN